MFGARKLRALIRGIGAPLGGVRRHLALGAAAIAALALGVGATVALADSGSATVTYTASQTVSPPPSSSFPGSSAGGDGWAVALSSTQVFNVFHHQSYLGVECHNQSDGSTCWPDDPTTITDIGGGGFATSGQPGLYLDQAQGHLYVYATRESDDTAGVVCIDVSNPTADPTLCADGFTALSAVGDGYVSGNGGISDPMLVGNDLYAFNYYPGAGVTGTQNTLMCFDLTTDAACAGQPYTVNLGLAPASTSAINNFPSPATAAINGQLFIPTADSDGNQLLACWDPSTGTNCAGQWPITLNGDGYGAGDEGAPFPMLDATGNEIGICLPNYAAPCYDFTGASVSTPAGLTTAIGGGDPAGWNGPGVVIGPRVYIPQWDDDVTCFDFSADATCANFPLSFSNLGLLYTVNTDPQRPTCLWVNSDNGSDQIQDFDAFTGGACGAGATRVLASQFIVPQVACDPTSYDSLQVTSPASSTFDTSGAPNGSSITFEDADGNPIPGVPVQYLDSTGTVNLTGLNLNGALGLPQFLISITNPASPISSVTVKLTWEDTYNSACTSTSVTATAPPSSTTVTQTVTQPGSTNTVTVTTPITTTVATTVTTPVNQSQVTHCPAPVGAIGGTAVGVFSVGMTQAQARATLARYDVTENKFDNFCLYHGWGIRLGYPTGALLKTVAKSARSMYSSHVVLALTANSYYALLGARPGAEVASVAKHLGLGKPFKVGSNDWYFGRGSYARTIVKVRNGVIQEVGLASLGLTTTRSQERVFINSFDKF
jgi:hypothetical protein